MSETTKSGGRPCAWCGAPVRQSGIGRTREYCSRSHRELAYRARRQQRLIDEAVARALAARPADVSTTDASAAVDASVVETAPVPAAMPEVQALPDAWRAAPPVRRPLSRRRSWIPADELPDGGPESI